jgi:hypothetical protein
MTEMFNDDGKFNRAWLESQTTERLRYEASCENVRGWRYAHRHTLMAALVQLPIIGATVGI